MKLLVVVDYQKDFVDGTLGFEGAEKLDEKIEIEINNALDDFMNGEIHTGGLYSDSTITRKKYIALFFIFCTSQHFQIGI